MGEQIKNTGNEIVSRWRNTMPKFFKWVFGVAAFIGGLAIAINEGMIAAGAQPHEWWLDIYPYLVGTSAGAAFCAKFTQTYPDKENHNTILDKDDN